MFVRLAKPIDYDSVDGKRVDLVCLLLMPAGLPNEHLAALAAVSRPMRDADFVTRLRRAGNAAGLGDLLRGFGKA
jgi:mannitol/fructose-specific phosphotransferase system IIA component (Ntr-type)